MAGPIRISILANAAQAKREFKDTSKSAQKMGKTLEAVGKVGARVGQRMAGAAAGVLKVAGAAVQVATTAVAAAPVVLKAGSAVVKFGTAAVNAAPALLAFAAAGVFVKLTMSQIGPAVVKSLSPITEGFKAAGVEAGKLASKGVKPLAAEFNRLGMPIISKNMNRIATATNGVVKGFLNWAKSGPGLQALRSITDATASAFEKVSPHVLSFATALGDLIGRIAGVSLSAGANGLTGVLDKLTEKMKGITADDVKQAFDDIKATFTSVRETIDTVKTKIDQAVAFYRKYETEIGLMADAFAVGVIIFGGPVAALAALVGLLIRHHDEAKIVVDKIKAMFAPGTSSGNLFDTLKESAQTLWDTLKKAFDDIKTAVMPILDEIKTKINDELVPAFDDFIVAVTPFVDWFIKVMVPVIKNAITTVLNIISGVITIITGIFQVFTGILTGDWSKCWEGIKNIAKGAGKILKSIIDGIWNGIKAAFNAGKAAVIGIWNGLFALVKSAIIAAKDKVTSVAGDILRAVRDKFNQLKTAVGDAMRAAKEKVTNGITAIKTAATNIDLFGAGQKIIRGLINGIGSMIGSLVSKMGDVASAVTDHLPFSPAKRGPLKRKPPAKAGRRILEQLGQGLSDTRGLSRAMGGAAGLIAGALSPGTLPTGSGRLAGVGGLVINFNGIVGDPAEVGRQVDLVLTKYAKRQGRS